MGAEIEDIIYAFSTSEEKNILLPTYVAYGVNALPPSNGFEFFKESLDTMMSEMQLMRTEMESFKSQVSKEDPSIVMKSINEMKADIQALKNSASCKPDSRTKSVACNIQEDVSVLTEKAPSKAKVNSRGTRPESRSESSKSNQNYGGPILHRMTLIRGHGSVRFGIEVRMLRKRKKVSLCPLEKLPPCCRRGIYRRKRRNLPQGEDRKSLEEIGNQKVLS